jgi:hypothetical protein
MPDHHFGTGTFSNELWIAAKRVFTRPCGVDVEFTSTGAFDWVFADASGTEVRTVRAANTHGGWTGVDLPSLGLHGDYSIGFRNASGHPQTLKQGDVHL